jgi:acyl-CoA synthetase (AMP-forming)/AMP-acid ligase II
MSFNFANILRESSNAHPHKALCHLGEHTFSYAQLDEISGRVATSLRALGVGRGDKVAVQLPNVPHFLFAYFGILKVGAVLVPLDPQLRAPEICYQLLTCDARLLITFESSAEQAVRGAAEIDGLQTYVVKAPIDARFPAGIHHFDELYFAEDTKEIEPTDADDTAVIVYTSGTTGKPKGAELTHFQMYISCTGAMEEALAGQEEGSLRRTTISAAVDLADRIVTNQYEFLRSVLQNMENAIETPRDKQK